MESGLKVTPSDGQQQQQHENQRTTPATTTTSRSCKYCTGRRKRKRRRTPPTTANPFNPTGFRSRNQVSNRQQPTTTTAATTTTSQQPRMKKKTTTTTTLRSLLICSIVLVMQPNCDILKSATTSSHRFPYALAADQLDQTQATQLLAGASNQADKLATGHLQPQLQLHNLQNLQQQQQRPPGSRQRFVAEPVDTFALLGGQAHLSCLVANKRRPISWFQDNRLIFMETNSFGFDRRYSMLATSDNETTTSALSYTPTAGDEPSDERDNDEHPSGRRPRPQADELVPGDVVVDEVDVERPRKEQRHRLSNYTLQIANVSVADEAQYSCSLNSFEPGGPTLESRKARLQVLRPPARLDIQATELQAAPSQQAATSNNEQPVAVVAAPLDDEQLQAASKSGPHQQQQREPLELSKPMELQHNHHNLHQHHQHQYHYQHSASGQPNHQISRLIVRQGARLRLECRSGPAKPRAELFWLDHERQRVPKLSSSPTGAGAEAEAGHWELANQTTLGVVNQTGDQLAQFAEELVQIDPEAPRMELSTLLWSFTVGRQHHNQILTCQASHKAYELGLVAGDGQPRQLEQSVQLDVQYEPVIVELTKSESAIEGRPIRFHCQAHGRPSELKYRWFIDGQPVGGGGSGPGAPGQRAELSIQRLTRQLHMREIKCEVSNQVGSSTAIQRLAVKYSPAFVTHLLPASLQPVVEQSSAVAVVGVGAGVGPPTGQQQHQNRKQPHHKTGHRLSQAATRQQAGDERSSPDDQEADSISRQLAVGFELGQDVQLRCDFDSNPRPLQVLWFKVATDYDSVKDVTPLEADELISSGAARAIFKWAGARRSPTPSDAHAKSSKRHISSELPSAAGRRQQQQQQHRSQDHESLDDSAPLAASRLELDYELMSAELLDELAMYEQQQQQQQQRLGQSQANQTGQQQLQPHGQSAGDSLIEPLVSEPPSQSSARIHEPLGWSWAPAGQPPAASNQSSPAGGPANSPRPPPSSPAPMLQLVLGATGGQAQQQQQQQLGAADRLDQRHAQLTSSSITIRAANEDSMGRYICKARAQDGFKSAARAVYLVLRQRPRIISVQEQWAPLGARRLQLECLVQINTIGGGGRGQRDQVSEISWTRDGKPINHIAQQQQQQQQPDHPTGTTGSRPTSYVELIEERSPDYLFQRSRLVIHGGQLSDFGQYNCTVTNAFGSDSMLINLQPTAPTGLTFKLLASLTLGSVFLFVLFLSSMFAFGPCRQLDAVTAKTAAIISAQTKAQQTKKEQQQLDHANAAASRSGSSASSKSSRSHRSHSSMMMTTNATDKIQLAAQLNLASNDRNSMEVIMRPTRPESAFEVTTSVGGLGAGQNQQQQLQLQAQHPRQHPFRSSLRPFNGGNGGNSYSAHRHSSSAKFAAIHESLEHKLHFGAAAAASKLGDDEKHNPGGRPLDGGGAPAAPSRVSPLEPAGSGRPPKAATTTTTTKQSGLMNRIWSKLASGGGQQSTVPAPTNAHRPRPTISMPLPPSGGGGGVGPQLTGGGVASSGHPRSRQAALSLKTSSQANLIQDSATASSCDGATGSGFSSGRSSSTSSSHQPQSMHHHHHHHQAHPQLSPGNEGPNIQQQSATGGWLQHQQQQQAQQVPLAEASYYANDGYSSMGLNGVEMCGQQVAWTQAATGGQQPLDTHCDQVNLANEILAANGGGLGMGMGGHYQLPVPQHQHQHQHLGMAIGVGVGMGPAGDQYVLVQHQQELAGASHGYQPATINGCQLAAAAPSTQPPTGINDATSIYGTSAPSLAQKIVPTNDDAEAYFESNYGTLLSRSSAYRTLGYSNGANGSGQLHNNNNNTGVNNGNHRQQADQQQRRRTAGSHSSSASSSPDSLTTHANIGGSNNNLSLSRGQHQQQHQQQQQSQSCMLQAPLYHPNELSSALPMNHDDGGGVDGLQQVADADGSSQDPGSPASPGTIFKFNSAAAATAAATGGHSVVPSMTTTLDGTSKLTATANHLHLQHLHLQQDVNSLATHV